MQAPESLNHVQVPVEAHNTGPDSRKPDSQYRARSLILVSHALESGVQLGGEWGLKHASSRAATQLLPVLRSESMQNLVTLGCTVLSTCRVSPDSACAQREKF